MEENEFMIDTVLFISSPNINCPSDTKVLICKDGDMPYFLPNELLPKKLTVNQCAVDLFSFFTGQKAKTEFSVGWVKLKEHNIFETISSDYHWITIPFSAIISSDFCKIPDSCKWASMGEIIELHNKKEFDEDHFQILTKICSKG